MICRNCGNEIDDNAVSCPICNTPFENPTKQFNPDLDNYPYFNPPEKDYSGFAVASLVLSLSAIPLYLCCFIGVIPSILALIFGILGFKSKNKGLAIAGFIVGIVFLVICIIFIAIGMMSEMLEFYGYSNSFGITSGSVQNY